MGATPTKSGAPKGLFGSYAIRLARSGLPAVVNGRPSFALDADEAIGRPALALWFARGRWILADPEWLGWQPGGDAAGSVGWYSYCRGRGGHRLDDVFDVMLPSIRTKWECCRGGARGEEKCAPAPALRTIYSQSSRDPNERDEL